MSIDHDRYGACHAQKEKSARKSLKEGLQQEKRHIAKKMLEKGYDVQTIHELTELSVEEIEGLK